MSLNTVVTDTESTLSHWQQPFWFAVVGFCLGLLSENLDWLYSDANGQYTNLIGFEMPLRWAFIVFLPVALLLWRTGKNMAVPIYLAILLVLAAWSGWNAQVEISADITGYYVSTNFMSIAFPLLLIGVVAISLPFVQTWQKQHPHWQYASLFAHAWDNTHTVLIAYAFATLSFLVLFLGALLLTTVGIDREQLNFVQQLTEHYLPITLAATGAGIGIIQQFSHVLLSLHTLVFTLYRLLAYLTAIIAVIFTLFLMPTLQKFLADKDAAFILLGLVVVSILFLNTLVEYGSTHLNKWANTLFATHLLVLPLLTAIAVYAITLRVQEFGLAPARMSALLLGLLLLVYTVAYAVQWLRYQRHWTEGLKAVNPPLALLAAVLGVLLLTPVLDPQSWSARHQLARLQNGQVTAALFDYHNVLHGFGKPGADAIAILKTWKSHPEYAVLTKGIQHAESPYPPTVNQANTQNVKVIPENKSVDMVKFLQAAQSLSWMNSPPSQYCLDTTIANMECFLVFSDVNADQQDEATLVALGQNKVDGKIQYTVEATLMRLDEQGLPIRAKLLANAISKVTREANAISTEYNPVFMTAETFAKVRQAVLLGKFTPVMPAMPELNIAGQHLREQ